MNGRHPLQCLYPIWVSTILYLYDAATIPCWQADTHYDYAMRMCMIFITFPPLPTFYPMPYVQA
jgi:hypothetical protein